MGWPTPSCITDILSESFSWDIAIPSISRFSVCAAMNASLFQQRMKIRVLLFELASDGEGWVTVDIFRKVERFLMSRFTQFSMNYRAKQESKLYIHIYTILQKPNSIILWTVQVSKFSMLKFRFRGWWCSKVIISQEKKKLFPFEFMNCDQNTWQKLWIRNYEAAT